MLEQILSNMHIDAELLAELDDEQKHILFFKMREEQVRRWKKWELELAEDQKGCPFISTKPKRAANLKVNFASGPDGKPLVSIIDDDVTNKSSTEKKAALIQLPSKVEPLTKTAAVAKPASTAKAPERVISPTEEENASVTKEAATDDSSVFSVFSGDENETNWQNSLKKSKEHDEMRRCIARMIRQSLGENPESSDSTNKPAVQNRTAPSPSAGDQSSKTLSVVKPPTAVKPSWMKSSKPSCRDDIISWFQDVEHKRRAGLEPGSDAVSEWFHGVISREEAEALLKGRRVGSFLVRVSDRVWGYVVSYLGTRADTLHGEDVQLVKHFLIDAGVQGYRFFGANRLTHPSLSALIKYHVINPVSLTGRETLKFPVGQNKEVPDYNDLFVGFSFSDETSYL